MAKKKGQEENSQKKSDTRKRVGPHESKNQGQTGQRNREKIGGKFNFGKIFLGLLLIFLGIILLGETSGLYQIRINIWQFWPVILVLIGLSLLTAEWKTSSIIAAVVILVVLIIMGVSIYYGSLETEKSGVRTDKVSVDKEEGVEKALVYIKIGAGKLILSGGSDKVVSGYFESDISRLEIESNVEDRKQEVSLSTTGSWSGWGMKVNNLRLFLNSDLRMRIELETGAMDMNIDLSDVKVESVDIRTGASNLNLVLGNRVERSDVLIKSGASSINLTIPEESGVRLSLTSGLSSKQFPPDFEKVAENVYESENFMEADDRIYLNLELGVSSLTIRRE